jgi:ectoine hydroxylase-related dioxygenase (phytanoyl-CoA dioxygenase family)
MTSQDATATRAPRLAADQLGAWERDGFVVLDRFLDPDLLAALRAGYDDILLGRVTADGDRMLGDRIRQVMCPSNAHPVFAGNAAVAAGLDIARQVFGTDEVHRTFDMLIDKPAGLRHETPWHQDFAYGRVPFTAPGTPIHGGTIQFWVALDDVDEENGCMQFIPGRHHEPLLEHVVVSGSADGRLLAIPAPETRLDLSRRVVAALPAGGCTLHAEGTPHYTGPNLSPHRRRRAYIFNVGPLPRR